MNSARVTTTVPVRHKATLRVPDAAGLEIVCTSGCLWVTLDGVPRDFILTVGGNDNTFRTSEHRAAIVYALSDSQVLVSAANERAVYARCSTVIERCVANERGTMVPLVAA